MRPLLLLVLAAASLAAPPPSATAPPDSLRSLPPPANGAVRVYLVRHGQALSNLDPVPDLPKEKLDHLTDAGRRQAAAAGHGLAGLGVGRVLTSPASRARETAAALAEAASAPEPAVEARLQPLRLGRAPDGRALTWTEREAVLRTGADPSPTGGESMETVGARVDGLVRELVRGGDAKAVVLVSHGEVIAAWLGRVRGVVAARRYPPGLSNGAIAVVDVRPDGRAEERVGSFVPGVP
jgi:broad specificity phosphatase PhoE